MPVWKYKQAHMAVVVQLGENNQNKHNQDIRTIGGIYRGTVVEDEAIVFKLPEGLKIPIEPSEIDEEVKEVPA